MVREVGVHDDDKITRAEIKAMNICGAKRTSQKSCIAVRFLMDRPETELASAWFEQLRVSVVSSCLKRKRQRTYYSILTEDLLKLFRNVLSSIR